jgi:hypothetical protein
MIVLVAVYAVGLFAWREHRLYTPLEGTWHGIGSRYSSLTMVVHRDQLILKRGPNSRASRLSMLMAAQSSYCGTMVESNAGCTPPKTAG